MIRPLTLLTVVAAAGAGLHVYNTKHAVSLLDRELRTIARDIGEAEARTKALNAEWSWATEQERLRALAHRHLALEPMQPAQFVRLAEAERRLPPPAAHDGPVAHFAPPPAAAGERTRIALLPPDAPPAAAPAAAPPLSAPVLAAVAQAAVAQAAAAEAPPLPLPAPAAPELRPVSRNTVAFTPPPFVRHVEPRPAEARAPDPRPVAVEPARAAPQPRPPARAVVAAAAPPAAAVPAPRPVVVAAAPPAAIPPSPRPQQAATQVAVAAVAPRAAEAATSLGSFGSALGGGGTALGSARAALPPPVAFGSVGAALR
jgi:hypothetical protein